MEEPVGTCGSLQESQGEGLKTQGHAGQGTLIFIPFFATYRSEENWEEPDSFLPDRFLVEDADVARSGQFSLTPEEQCVLLEPTLASSCFPSALYDMRAKITSPGGLPQWCSIDAKGPPRQEPFYS